MTSRFLTLEEVAAPLRIARKTLLNSFSRGAGPYADMPRVKPGRHWLIPADQFAQWLAARTRPGRSQQIVAIRSQRAS